MKLFREVTVPGHLGARKGVNTPDVILNMSPITPKDRMLSSTGRLGNVPGILEILYHYRREWCCRGGGREMNIAERSLAQLSESILGNVQDKADLKFCCKHDVDWVAMSFVQKHEDGLLWAGKRGVQDPACDKHPGPTLQAYALGS